MGQSRTKLQSGVGLAVAFAICFGVAALGSIWTAGSVDGWYQGIQKPSWNPPDWIFGPVWTLLYSAMAVAVWDVWRSNRDAKNAIIIFAIQLGLNALWSALFFGLHSPGWAFVEIVVLIVSIVITMIAFYRRLPRASMLLSPYLAWTVFAAVLNGSIWCLNL